MGKGKCIGGSAGEDVWERKCWRGSRAVEKGLKGELLGGHSQMPGSALSEAATQPFLILCESLALSSIFQSQDGIWGSRCRGLP